MFEKPPSAELRPDQKDTDSIPSYEVLDPILRAYVEEYKSPRQIADETGAPIELVKEIINKVDRNEYKRQQAAPGLKVTTKAFGIGRRFPSRRSSANDPAAQRLMRRGAGLTRRGIVFAAGSPRTGRSASRRRLPAQQRLEDHGRRQVRSRWTPCRCPRRCRPTAATCWC